MVVSMLTVHVVVVFFFSSRRRHTRLQGDWSSDVCSSDLQWYWDSCFHAIVWRRFDRARAESELRSLLAGGSDDGFIGHTTFWDRPVDWQRRWTYNVTSRDAPSTSTIQPPLIAWAWRIAVGDPAAERR